MVYVDAVRSGDRWATGLLHYSDGHLRCCTERNLPGSLLQDEGIPVPVEQDAAAVPHFEAIGREKQSKGGNYDA